MRRSRLSLWVRIALWAIILLPFRADSSLGAEGGPPNWAGQNILMIVADDLGVDKMLMYQPPGTDPEDFPRTPNLDQLAADGARFDRAWANPNCSPTRATILTGNYGFRTGVTDIIRPNYPSRLFRDELTIPLALEREEFRSPDGEIYEHAAFGKWHLSNCLNGHFRHPTNAAGFSTYSGSINNFKFSGPDPMPIHTASYFDWFKTIDGVPVPVTTYATTDTVDDAASWIEGREGPWFVYLSFNAPHLPAEVPPP